MKTINIKCPICSSENTSEYLYKDVIKNKNIVRCKNCEIQYLYPYPTKEELDDIYSNDYVAWGTGEDIFSKMKRKKFRKLLKHITKYKKFGKLLDVGCGPGYLMEEAKEFGFDVYGVDIGQEVSNTISKKFGSNKFYNGILENSNFNKNYFDIIIMSDVLEHVENPISFFKAAYKLLSEDGCIIITTPDTNSLTCKLMKNKWSLYILEHIHYFNNKSIRELCSITGFNVVKIKPYTKILTLKYMSYIFKYNNKKILYNIFNKLGNIPIIGNLNIPISIGEFFIVLNKK